MAEFSAKCWFKSNVDPYLRVIKSWVLSLFSPLSTRVDNLEATVTQLSSITGVFKGSFELFSEITSITGARSGDWAVLKSDDGSYESGIYVKSSSAWSFVCDLVTFQDIRADLIATDSEVSLGTSTTKVMSVKQVVDKVNYAISMIDLSSKADVSGNANILFNVAGAEEGSTQSVRADQFGLITLSEAQEDWNSIT